MGDGEQGRKEDSNNGGVRLKMRLPKAEVEKLIQGSKNQEEAAERIVKLYMANGSRDTEENGDKTKESTKVCDICSHAIFSIV